MDCPYSDAALLVNSRSRRGSEWFAQSKNLLQERGVNLIEAAEFAKIDPLLAQIKKLKRPDRLIIVGGGDGTLGAAAGLLADSRAIMGVMPLGTGNAFARDLQIPTNVEAAVEVLTDGEPANIDLGICNGRYFVNVVTMGLTETVARTLTVPMKRRFGRLAYIVAVGKALQHIRPFKAEIVTENGKTQIEAVQVVIGNGRYHAGPLPLSPDATIVSGVLHVYAVEFGSRAAMIKSAILVPTGLQGILRTVHSEDTKGGIVTTKPKRTLVQDGEFAGKSPIRFASAPGALRVMAPSGFDG